MTNLFQNFLAGSVGGFTHTRTGSATFKDFENVIKTVPTNEPAFPGMRVVTNLTPDPESETLWEANGTNPPTLGASVEYLGKTALATLTFDDTMTITGYAGCRGDASNGDGYSQIVADREYRHSVEIALSRNLVSGEQITFYSTGTSGSPGFAIDENNDFEDWTIITANIHIPTGTGVNFPVFYMQENINPGNDPVILYIRNCMTEEVTGQTNQNPSSYVNGTAFYDYENGNTLSSNVVTEAEGAAITGITGLQVEGARVNLNTETTDIDGSWTHTGLTVTNSFEDVGDLPLAKLVHDDTNTDRTATLVMGNSDGDPACWAVYVKEGDTPDFSVRLYDNTAASDLSYHHYDWTAGAPVLSSTVAGTQKIDDLGGGLFKITVTAASTVNGNALACFFYPTKNGDAAVSAQYMLFNPGNLEQDDFPSSVIETAGATVTRNATSVTKSHVFPSNNFEFTLVARMNFDHDDVKSASDLQILLLDDGTANNVLDVTLDATNDQIHLNKTVSGGSAVTASTTATDLNYSRGDKLTITCKSNSAGMHLTVNELDTVVTTTGDSKEPWVTLMDTITIQPGFIDVESLVIRDLSGEKGLIKDYVKNYTKDYITDYVN